MKFFFLFLIFCLFKADLLLANQCALILQNPSMKLRHDSFDYESTLASSIKISNHIGRDELGIGFDPSGHSIIFFNGKTIDFYGAKSGYRVTSYLDGDMQNYSGDILIVFKNLHHGLVSNFQALVNDFDSIPKEYWKQASLFKTVIDDADLTFIRPGKSGLFLNYILKLKTSNPLNIDILALKGLRIRDVEKNFKSLSIESKIEKLLPKVVYASYTATVFSFVYYLFL